MSAGLFYFMSQRLDERLRDWAVYWDEHKNDGGDIEQRLRLREKVIEGMFELFAHTAAAITELEGRPREDLGRKIWTPGPISVRGDLSRFG
jgi:hypothetical protein